MNNQINRNDGALKAADAVINFHKQKGNLDGLIVEPKGLSFATQDLDEKIYLFARRHWSENIGWFIRNIFYVIFPIFFLSFLVLINVDITLPKSIDYPILFLCYFSLIFTNVFRLFFDWYFDPYIVTNKRIVHYEFKPFSKYVIKETSLSSIENVSEQSAGIYANLWGYGTLTVSTEATDDLFVFKKVSNATRARDILVDLINVARKYYGDTGDTV